MKQLLVIVLFSIGLSNAIKAQNHFIYIQSDNKQPFNVVLNKKVFSSTASGYVIIPKLTEGIHNITVGFAPGTFADQNFNLAINKKDLGFSLKDFPGKGWGLFDLQTFGITYAGSPSTILVNAEGLKPQTQKKEDELITFSKPPTKPVEVPETKPVVVLDTQVIAKVVEIVPEKPLTAIDSITLNSNLDAKTDVKKVAENKDEEGISYTYVDSSSSLKKDTVQVIIPLTKREKKKAEAKSVEEKKALEKLEVAPKPNNEVKFIEIEPKVIIKETSASTNVIPPGINCKELAVEDDYNKLRKKMARETSDEKMIAEATKAFKNKCFSTEQVKSLSTLFLSDEGRFNFFNAIYTLVVNPQSYELLEKEFIDPVFTARFRTMLKS